MGGSRCGPARLVALNVVQGVCAPVRAGMLASVGGENLFLVSPPYDPRLPGPDCHAAGTSSPAPVPAASPAAVLQIPGSLAARQRERVVGEAESALEPGADADPRLTRLLELLLAEFLGYGQEAHACTGRSDDPDHDPRVICSVERFV